MKLRAKPACALAAMLLVGGCALEPLQARRPAQPGVSTAPARLPAPSRKEVADKRNLNVLIATDGTVCTVPEQTFRNTDIGDRVTCVWRREADASYGPERR